MAEHFGRRGILVLISDFYEEPDAVLEAIGPLRFRGNDLIVFHVLDPAELDFTFDDASSVRGPRERRADPGRAGGARASSIATLVQAHIDALTRALLRQPHRLHAAQHVDAARPRAVQLSVGARAADEGAVTMCFSDPALPRRPRRARDSGAAPPDSARAEERRPVSVADVPAADSVSVGAAAPDPALAAAAAAAGGAGADRAGVRAAVLAARRRCGRGAAAARAKSSSCSIARTAWATAIAGSRRVAAARDAIDGLKPSDRASLVFFASSAEVALRSTSDRGRLQRRVAGIAAGRRRDALRPGAEAGRQHPERVGAAAARGDPDHAISSAAAGRAREGVRLPDGAVLTPVAGRRRRTANLSRHAGLACSARRSRISSA